MEEATGIVNQYACPKGRPSLRQLHKTIESPRIGYRVDTDNEFEASIDNERAEFVVFEQLSIPVFEAKAKMAPPRSAPSAASVITSRRVWPAPAGSRR